MMDPQSIEEILRLKAQGMATRAVARKLGLDPKTVRRAINRHGPKPPPEETVPGEPSPGKLTPYLEAISEKAEKGLTATRILREIRELGYTGGRTILTDYLRELRGPARRKKRSFRRFETGVAEESQADWSPYRVEIAGRMQTVHCFALILCHSRYRFCQFHRDERLPTLLSAHVDALRWFEGCSRRIVYDNMATITFGRRGKEILWNPEFLKFSRHYAFEPFLCRVRDPNRKGKIESIFREVDRDLLRGRTFSSWEELDRTTERWLREVANRRRHSTTRQVPEEAWKAEREFLTALPEAAYLVYREEIRTVYEDGLLSFDGTRYSVPSGEVRPGCQVRVRGYPRHIDILNPEGHLVASHPRPDLPGGLVVVPEHYEGLRPKPGREPGEIERRFLARFPQSEAFLDGLKRRMKSLYRLHLTGILRLAQLYGDPAVAKAIARARRYGNFNAYAVGRILRQRHPLVPTDCPPPPPAASAQALAALEGVESGSFDDYESYSRGKGSSEASQDKKEEE